MGGGAGWRCWKRRPRRPTSHYVNKRVAFSAVITQTLSRHSSVVLCVPTVCSRLGSVRFGLAERSSARPRRSVATLGISASTNAGCVGMWSLYIPPSRIGMSGHTCLLEIRPYIMQRLIRKQQYPHIYGVERRLAHALLYVYRSF